MTLSSERNTQQMQLWGRLMAALPFSLWPRAATKPSVWWTSSMLTSQGESECLSLSLWLFPFLFIYVISSRFLFDRLFIYGLLFYCFQRAALLVKWIIIVVFFGGIIRMSKICWKCHIFMGILITFGQIWKRHEKRSRENQCQPMCNWSTQQRTCKSNWNCWGKCFILLASVINIHIYYPYYGITMTHYLFFKNKEHNKK